jgi:hypothetical protein
MNNGPPSNFNFKIFKVKIDQWHSDPALAIVIYIPRKLLMVDY